MQKEMIAKVTTIGLSHDLLEHQESQLMEMQHLLPEDANHSKPPLQLTSDEQLRKQVLGEILPGSDQWTPEADAYYKLLCKKADKLASSVFNQGYYDYQMK